WLKIFKPVFAQMAEAERSQLPAHPPKKTTPALAWENYLGTYANDFFGPAKVISTDGNLALVLGPKDKTYPLTHWDRDTFTYEPSGEMAAGPSAVTFTLGTDGRASRVTIEHLDVHGSGTFQRAPAPTP